MVLDAAKEENIKYSEYFKFNNSVVFSDNDFDTAEEEGNFCARKTWKMGTDSFNRLFKKLSEIQKSPSSGKEEAQVKFQPPSEIPNDNKNKLQLPSSPMAEQQMFDDIHKDLKKLEDETKEMMQCAERQLHKIEIAKSGFLEHVRKLLAFHTHV